MNIGSQVQHHYGRVIATTGFFITMSAMGLATLGHGTGQMMGPAIGGALIDATHSFYSGFLLAASAILVEIAVIAVLPSPRPATS